jgi:hypothetical protein
MHPSSGHLIAAAVLLAVLVAGCSGAPEKKQIAEPEPALKPCGSEIIQRGGGYDAAARECIWQSYKARELAQFTTTRFTIEGDPISYRIEVTPPGVVVVVDSKDRFGLKGVFRHTCRAFERIAQEDRPDRFGFALSGCAGGGADRLAVP